MLLAKEDVLGLEVAVHHAFAVGVSHSLRDLHADAQRLGYREGTLAQPLRQRMALQ